MRNALKDAHAVVVLLSPSSLDNRWVQFEIGAAEAMEKQIIPVLIAGDHTEDHMPEILRDRTWVDARHRPDEEVVRDLKRAVEAASR